MTIDSIKEMISKHTKKSKREMTVLPKSSGHPFCITFLFTKTGLVRFCGSLDNIRKKTDSMSICHGIVHFYKFGKVNSKCWDLFGEGSDRYIAKINKSKYFSLQYIRSGQEYFGDLEIAKLIGKPKQTKYFLTFKNFEDGTVDIIASWRKLPSSYIKEFDKEIL